MAPSLAAANVTAMAVPLKIKSKIFYKYLKKPVYFYKNLIEPDRNN